MKASAAYEEPGGHCLSNAGVRDRGCRQGGRQMKPTSWPDTAAAAVSAVNTPPWVSTAWRVRSTSAACVEQWYGLEA